MTTSPLERLSRSGGPIVVGGLGGSGTRLVAEILQQLGIFLGEELNDARDNLWFTLLFKRPRWYAETMSRNPNEVQTGLAILERALVGRGDADIAAWAFLLRAVREAMFGGHGQKRAGTPGWPLRQTSHLVRALCLGPKRTGPWGWKEPNSHIFLRPMAEHWRDLKFIYVARHGLDMAFSGNQTQLHLWGPLYGVAPGVPGEPAPRAMLEYWIKASERAIADGRSLLGERFMVLNYDRLSAHPDEVLPGLIDFLKIDRESVPLEQIRKLAVLSSSTGRYRKHDLAVFDARSLEAVKSLGFDVE